MKYEKNDIVKAVEEAKKQAKKRGFKQTVELMISLKDVDLSKPEKRIDDEIVLPHKYGKDIKIAVIGGGELAVKAKKAGADLVIDREELIELGESRKKAKQIAKKHDFFVAQADFMPLVGKHLGPVLGPRGKMPTPTPPTADIEGILKKLRKTVKIRARDTPVIHIAVGIEEMSSEDISTNIETVLSRLERKLERGMQNIDTAYVKLTMGPAVKIEGR